jgi:hypothetical protein
MFASWFSRRQKHHSRAARPTKRWRPQLELEALEERLVMNTYFVVPGPADNTTTFKTLQDALNIPTIQNGDVIQIEPGSTPGHIFDSDIPNVKNLTIQGNPNADVQAIPYFYFDDAAVIQTARQGFTLKHLEFDTYGGTLVLNTDVTITACRMQNDFDGYAIDLDGANAAVISDCYFENLNTQLSAQPLLRMQPSNGSHNRVTDNQFVAIKGSQITLLDYFGAGANAADVVAHNSFLDNTGNSSVVAIQGNTVGLTFQSNTLMDESTSGVGIFVEPSVQNLQIVDNVISFPFGTSAWGIVVGSGSPVGPSSMVIASNHIHTGNAALDFVGETPGFTWSARVENNDLADNPIGVFIDPAKGGSMAGIDLGGGNQGSLGANNFRNDSVAIFCAAAQANGPIQAQGNIFGVDDPGTVIHDNQNDPKLASVVWTGTTGPLTGNAAYVATLYLDFLHRTGNVNDPNDAGGWVTLLDHGAPALAVATAIARSEEGLDVAVDGLYHRFLGRDADPAGRAGFGAALQAGGTLENVTATLLGSQEYQSRCQTDDDFVQALYQGLLHRTASATEVSQWEEMLPPLGRTGVAQQLEASDEFRTGEIEDDYVTLLHRPAPPSAAEVSGWVGSGLDILTLDTYFAASQEFQMNG